MSNYPTSTAHKRSQKAGNSSSSPLPGQKAMFALNMPEPGSKKAVCRVFATEQELCEATGCPVPFEDSPSCSVDCKKLKRNYQENREGVYFQGTLRCAAGKLKASKIIGLIRRAV